MSRPASSALVLVSTVLWLAFGCSSDYTDAGSTTSADQGAAGLAATAGQAGSPVSAAGQSGSSAAGTGTSIGASGTGASSAADGGGVPTGGPDAGADVDPSLGAGAFSSLPACSAGLSALFSKAVIQPPTGGSGVFHPASIERRGALEAAVRALVAGRTAEAAQQAEVADYELCSSDDDGDAVLVIRPITAGEGHAVIAWRIAPKTPLIVEAPHAWHDVDTDIEGYELFVTLDARALVMSGISRCASLNAGPCDGTTTACTGLPIPYTESDAAHNVELLFQSAHVALAESFADDHVVSLHGFGDSGVSVSNATPSAMPAAGSLHVRLVEALAAQLPGEKITSCQQYAGAPYEKRMCGSENVQARHVNGSPNVCGQNASATSNRFVHVEQSRAVRDNRAAVIAAFAAALP